MIGSLLHSRIHFVLSALIAFWLPFKQGTAVLIVLLFLNWILEGDFSNKIHLIKNKKTALLFVALYLFYVIGLLWSTNLNAGVFDLQVKLSLLIFPIIYSTRPLDIREMNKVITLFIIGCTLAIALLMARATYFYFTKSENDFLYTDFSKFMHPSYFAMYLNFGLVYLLITIRDSENYLYKYRLILTPLFCIVILQLCSKIGYVSLFCTIVGWSIYAIIKYKKLFVGLTVLALLAASIIFSFNYSNLIYGRLKGTFNTLSDRSIVEDKGNTESTAVRINIWKAAIDISLARPFLGYGTGSAQEQLLRKYKDEGIQRALLLKLNAHNAFFQILVSLGYIGLLLFLVTLFLPVLIAGKEYNWLFVLFIFLFVLSCIPESILEAQAGTMYFGFFNSLLFFSKEKNTNK